MRLSYAASALALISSTSAFSDTSPFVLISSARFTEPPSQNQLQTASQVEKTAKSFLESCPTDRYLVVLQPGLNPDDLRGDSGRSVPNLQRALSHDSAATAWSIASVAGEVSIDEITDFINDACAKVDKVHLVEEMSLPTLPAHNGAGKLAENDYTLSDSIKVLQSEGSYTIVYISSPGQAYEAQEPVHQELKRGPYARVLRREDNDTERDTRGLFEKYEFFNKGLFMTLFASLFFVTILSIGIRALASLEVSYGAFTKEMGPGAQKKQQL